MQNDRSLISKQINTALSRIINPSLEISDSMAVNRALGLLSDPSHFIAVIDQNNNILLADYSNMTTVRKILLNHALDVTPIIIVEIKLNIK